MKGCSTEMTLLNKKINIAIFASGSGSNAEVLITKAHALGVNVKYVITDNRNAGVIDRCKRLKVPYRIVSFMRIPGNTYAEDKSIHEQRIMNLLDQANVKWVFLAGYMRILGQSFLDHFYNPETKQNNVINIHPSLLPNFPGKKGYFDAYSANVQESGITVHYVDSGIDTGSIIAQEKFIRLKDDTLEDFSSRGLALEHKLYPEILEKVLL